MRVTTEQRLQLIAAALTGILAKSYDGTYNGEDMAVDAVYHADCLINELRNEDIEGGESSASTEETQSASA